jgi:hypothetical protein
MEFWAAALEALRASGVNLYDNISPTQDHWLSAGSGVSGCPYHLIFGKTEARVELNLSRASTEENKWLFDQLFAQKAEIEAAFGEPLVWKRLDEKKSSRIECGKEFDCYQRENWPEVIRWMVEHLRRLEAAFSGPLNKLGRSMRQTGRVA